MILFICHDCGAVFDEPREKEELMGDNFTVDEQEYVLDSAGQAFAEKEVV